jgi:hypothetical protein
MVLIMSKSKTDIGSAIQGFLSDTTGFVRKASSYDYSQDLELFQENANSASIDALVEEIHAHRERLEEIVDEPEKIAEIKLNLAKREAALRGFSFPLDDGELERFGESDLKPADKKIVRDAVKQAMLEAAADKVLEGESYGEFIYARTQGLLQKKSVDLIGELGQSGLKDKKITKMMEFATEGYVALSDKPEPVKATERVQTITSQFERNNTNLDAIIAQRSEATELLNRVIKNIKHGPPETAFTPEGEKKIKKELMPTLVALGSSYIGTNYGMLTNEIAASLKSNKSFSTRLTGNYSISDKSLKNIAKKIDKEHGPKATRLSLSAISPSSSIINEVIAKMEREQKIKFSNEEVDKISKALKPCFSSMDFNNPNTNKQSEIDVLATKLTKAQGFSTKITGKYTISSKKLEEIAGGYSTASGHNEMEQKKITKGLTVFSTETGAGVPNVGTLSIEDLAKIRQARPGQFDRAFDLVPPVPQSPVPSLEKAVSTGQSIPAPLKDAAQAMAPPPVSSLNSRTLSANSELSSSRAVTHPTSSEPHVRKQGRRNPGTPMIGK